MRIPYFFIISLMSLFPFYDAHSTVIYIDDMEPKEVRSQLSSLQSSNNIKEQLKKFSKVKIIEEGTLPCQFVCHEYAAFRITGLTKEGLNKKTLTAIGNMGFVHRKKFIDFFEPTDTPQKGALVVYYNSNRPHVIEEGYWPHSGIYMGNNLIQSTWGNSGFVFETPLFMVPENYGNAVRFYTLKPSYIPSQMVTYFSELKE